MVTAVHVALLAAAVGLLACGLVAILRGRPRQAGSFVTASAVTYGAAVVLCLAVGRWPHAFFSLLGVFSAVQMWSWAREDLRDQRRIAEHVEFEQRREVEGWLSEADREWLAGHRRLIDEAVRRG